MGLFDLLRRDRADVNRTRSALEEANDPATGGGAITSLIQRVLSLGIDGRGPFDSAATVAAKALAKGGSTDEAIDRIVASHVRSGAAGGFVTSLGGFITLPVALPANVLEFYVLATRMTAAIAHLRGYDLAKPSVRSAVLLALVGSKADDVLAKAGVAVGGGRWTAMALDRLPKAALMVINKAVGFRLLRMAGEKTLARFGRLVPILGGVIGGGLDGYMMSRIGRHARTEFPQTLR